MLIENNKSLEGLVLLYFDLVIKNVIKLDAIDWYELLLLVTKIKNGELYIMQKIL